jgi:hypothetical protein
LKVRIDWFSAHWAGVVASLDPALDAARVEEVLGIASQTDNLVSLLVLSPADDALFVVF